MAETRIPELTQILLTLNQCIMIDYAVVLLANPQKPDEAKKAYAFLQSRGTLRINDLADHMVSHGCNYDRGDIIAILVKLVSCSKELMLDGYRIELGDLGKLYLTVQSNGAKTKDEFTRANIKAVNVNFSASNLYNDLIQKVSLHKVPTRKAVAAALQAELEGKTQADWTPEPEEEETTEP